MVVALWRHRHYLPADQLDPLVLIDNAGRDHGLQLRHGEAQAHEPSGRLGRPVHRIAVQVHHCHAASLPELRRAAKLPGAARLSPR